LQIFTDLRHEGQGPLYGKNYNVGFLKITNAQRDWLIDWAVFNVSTNTV